MNTAGPGRRAAAIGALLLAAAALVVAAGGLYHHVVLLVEVWAALTLTAAGAWWALSRRGARRAVGAVLALAGLVLIVVAFATQHRLVWFAADVVVLAGALTLARIALAQTRRSLVAATPPGTRVAPARHPVLLMNPKSGGGKVEHFHLVDEARRRGIEPVVLERGDDLIALARDAIARGADVIGMAGGDGSQALVATVAAEHDVAHVCIPAGTRNHLALDLGLDRDDVVGALDAFGDAVERRIDLAKIGDRVFVNNASLGIYAEIVQSAEYRDAKVATTASRLPDLLGPDGSRPTLRFRDADGGEHTTADLILVSNNPYQLTRLGGIGTRPRLDTGALGIVTLHIESAADMAKLVTLETTGRVNRFPGWLEWTSGRFEIDADGDINVGVDGEALTLPAPLVFTTMPGALRVRIPTHAPGSSPAASAVHFTSRRDVANLLRIAAGKPAHAPSAG